MDEAHVKGLTQTHPSIPDQLRGTYAGTPIPPQPRLHTIGLRKHWGYNTFRSLPRITSTWQTCNSLNARHSHTLQLTSSSKTQQLKRVEQFR